MRPLQCRRSLLLHDRWWHHADWQVDQRQVGSGLQARSPIPPRRLLDSSHQQAVRPRLRIRGGQGDIGHRIVSSQQPFSGERGAEFAEPLSGYATNRLGELDVQHVVHPATDHPSDAGSVDLGSW